MPPTRVRADYEKLAQIAGVFSRQADLIQKASQSLKSKQAQLAGGGWCGRGADKFYAEMNSQVEPSLKKLHNALSEAAQATKRISQVMKRAEEDAARVLRGQGNGTGPEAAGTLFKQRGQGDTPPTPRRAGVTVSPSQPGSTPSSGSSGSFDPNRPPSTLTPKEIEVLKLTSALGHYGVTVDYNGTFTPAEKAAMLRNIYHSVTSMGKQSAATLNELGQPMYPHDAFEAVFGPTHFTLTQSSGTLTDPETGKQVYGYNSGLDASGVNQITLSSYALMNNTQNSPPEGGEKVTVTPVQLVAHEVAHNLSSDYLLDNNQNEYHFLHTSGVVPAGWNIEVNARSTAGTAEFTADYIAHWALADRYGYDVPPAVSEFMKQVIQHEVGMPGHEAPVQLYYPKDFD